MGYAVRVTPAAELLALLAEPTECWPASAALAEAAVNAPWTPTPPPVLVLEEHSACRVRSHGAPGVRALPPADALAAVADGLVRHDGPDRVRLTPPVAWLDAPVSFRWRACPVAARGAERAWTVASAESCLLEQLPGSVSGRAPWVHDPPLDVAGWGDTTLLDGLLRVYAAADLVPLVVQLDVAERETGRAFSLHTSLRSRASWP